MTTSRAASHDWAEKLLRLRGLLEARGADAVMLTSAASLAWLFGGARVSVPLGGPPVLSAEVSRDGVRVHVHANELDRLVAEELEAGDVDLVPVPWHQALPSEGRPGMLLERDHDAALRRLRTPLTVTERTRYRSLGSDLARAVTPVLAGAQPGHTEVALAAELAREVVAIGADPVVLLVAGRDRLGMRHPLPTGGSLGTRAMAVVGARRRGLVANLTRWIAFEPDPHSDEVDARLREVEADAFEATRPGTTLGGALAAIAASYERHGFGGDAWLGHHQGGPTGYAGRDPRASPGSTEMIADHRAFAWNPTAPGAKLEDTVLLTDGAIEVLTADPSWPVVDVRELARPTPLEIG